MGLKTIVLAMLICVCMPALKTYASTYKIYMNSAGDKIDAPDNVYDQVMGDGIKFCKGDSISIIIENPDKKYRYVSDIVKKATDYEIVPVFTGKVSAKFTNLVQPDIITVNLDRSGYSYQVKIIRYKLKDFEERKEGITIAKFSCKTNIVYYFGAHVGVYIPLVRKNIYGVKALPDQPPFSGSSGIIMKQGVKECNAIFIGTIYPFGFEPELLFLSNYSYNFKDYFSGLFTNIYKLIHIDLAFELSKNIFSKLYFGGGLSFGLCSVSVLACYEKVESPNMHFGNHQIFPGIISILSPVRERYQWSYGVSVTLPIDFAFSWIGSSLK